MPTVATAYVQVMPSMEGATSNITDAILPQIDAAGEQAGASFGGKFGSKLSGALSKFVAPAAIAATAAAAGKALFDLGAEFDDMTDSIIVGTGASGEALDGLVQSAKNIATTVPTSFADAGDIVQNLNTRLGLTGDNLEALGSRVIEAGNLLGEAVNVDSLTGAFNTFGVSADDAASKMDYLFNVGQATGINLNTLTSTLEKQAPALKSLGFSFEESANMAGLLDKAGLDASSTMSRLSKVLAQSAEDGVPAREAYEGIVGQLQDYLAAGDEVAALDLANEVFGTRGAAQFLDAVKQGTLSLDAMQDAALGAGDGILGTMERTEDFGEKLERLKNKAAVALEPLASGVFDAVGQGLTMLETFVDENSAAFETLGSIAQTLADIVGSVLSIAFDVLSMAFQPVLAGVAAVGDAFNNVLGVIQGAFDFMAGIVNRIKGLFSFEFSLPGLKLPHIIVGEYIDVPVLGRIPNPMTLHVEWYAQGGIVNSPTLFGAGEAGPEAIVPLTAPNLAPFANAVANAMGGSGGIYIENMTVQANDLDEFVLSVERTLGRMERM